jgi:Ion channel
LLFLRSCAEWVESFVLVFRSPDVATFWTSALGIVIIGWTLREVFMDLFQPSGSGSLSLFLGRRVFQVSKRFPGSLRVAGPLNIVVVISCWALLLASGFALFYWGRFPQAFRSSVSPPHNPISRFSTALYFSLSSLTTLASGELAPVGNWIRLVTALESLIGASLVTASITWIVLIYPAHGRIRALSRRTFTLARAQKETGIDLFSVNAEALLADLSVSVIRVRIDLIYFPLVYYFQTDSEGSSVSGALIQLARFAEQASREKESESVRLSAAILTLALGDIAETLSTRFVPKADSSNPLSVFEAVRRDHQE